MNGFVDAVAGASGGFLLAAFLLYCAAFLLFGAAVAAKRRWDKAGFPAAAAGFACHLLFFFTRWYRSGFIPVSNMYEFMTFLAMMIVFAVLVLYLLYKSPALCAFSLPVGIVILAYASVFPKEITPLIPALQSRWLAIHVTLAASGEAFFAAGFAAGLMVLIRTVDFRSIDARWKRRGVEFTLFAILAVIGFAVSSLGFQASGFGAVFETPPIRTQGQAVESRYTLPPLVAPHNGTYKEGSVFVGMQNGLLQAPGWMKGEQAGRKLNTVVWSLLAGVVLYGGLRSAARKPLGAVVQPLLRRMDPEDLDEIAYRSIAIGYPVFTLGALIFAMIWAHEAWGRFWGWDPKEVWALITWLFYAVYLHLRLSRGWHGEKSAWLAVLGFIIVIFTLIGVNLVITGLHSYAGV
jgi:ABC-type transport system involved in cytochrome c biogenesis permease subunit